MTKYALGGFLIIYGFTALVNTSIPPWVTGAVALAAGLVCLIEGVRGK